MFELLATIDPLSAIMGGLWLFAAGMFPVGLMLGSSCSPCCGDEPCSACTQGSLPETITATLDGFTDYSKRQLCTLSFSACYGSGGSGTVDAPGQTSPESDPVDDRGPITAVSITDGGSGYARLGRTAPTVTVTGSGTGATFNVTLTSSKDSCGLDVWSISAVSASGGDGYTDGEYLTVAVSEGDTEVSSAIVALKAGRSEPTLTIQGGAVATVTTKHNSDDTWSIESVSVVPGAEGYTDGSQINVDLNGATQVSPATLIANTIRVAPTVELQVFPGAGYAFGASLTPTLTETTDENGDPAWVISSVAIESGGADYWVGDLVVVPNVAVVGEVETVDEVRRAFGIPIGPITGIKLYDGVFLWKEALDSVSVEDGGSFFAGGGAQGTEITDGGIYYREDASLPPYVATVTVAVNQTAPSQGSGASISATVGSDPENAETFGKITGLTVNSGGSGYLAWEWTTNGCCGHYLNGKSIVLTRFKDSNAAACEAATLDFFGQYNILFSPEGGQSYPVPSRCVYTTQFCGGWTSPFIWGPVWDKIPVNDTLQLYVGFRGEGQRPVIKLGPFCNGGRVNNSSGLGVSCLQDWIADEPIESCSQFSFSASPTGRPSVTVNSGGTYDPEWRFSGCDSNPQCPSCNVCCQGDDDVPEEIEVVVTDEWTTNRPDSGRMPNFSGTYVATGGPNYWLFGGIPPGFIGISGQFGINPCHEGTMPLYVTGPRGSCKTCIKKCRVWISGMRFQWYNSFGVFIERRIAQLPPTDECSDCENTPVCSPSGKSFSLNSADPAIVGYGDGVHAATVTIQ